jgi:hypothetical protein
VLCSLIHTDEKAECLTINQYARKIQLLIIDPDWMDDELAKNFGDQQ